MVIVDAFTHYVALNAVPHCNPYYAYTTLYENWIGNFGLPEILVTDNGTEFTNKELITLCHLYNITDTKELITLCHPKPHYRQTTMNIMKFFKKKPKNHFKDKMLTPK